MNKVSMCVVLAFFVLLNSCQTAGRVLGGPFALAAIMEQDIKQKSETDKKNKQNEEINTQNWNVYLSDRSIEAFLKFTRDYLSTTENSNAYSISQNIYNKLHEIYENDKFPQDEVKYYSFCSSELEYYNLYTDFISIEYCSILNTEIRSIKQNQEEIYSKHINDIENLQKIVAESKFIPEYKVKTIDRIEQLKKEKQNELKQLSPYKSLDDDFWNSILVFREGVIDINENMANIVLRDLYDDVNLIGLSQNRIEYRIQKKDSSTVNIVFSFHKIHNAALFLDSIEVTSADLHEEIKEYNEKLYLFGILYNQIWKY